MKEILKGIKKTEVKVDSKLELANILGFNRTDISNMNALKNKPGLNKFLKITTDKIYDFLKRKTIAKNKLSGLKLTEEKKIFVGGDSSEYTFLKLRGMNRMRTYFIVNSYWTEYPVNKYYKELPPTSVLKRFKEVKDMDVFDNFSIAEIEIGDVKLPDPFLLGRIKGSTDRFFIAQWDDDYIDDVI